MQKHRKSSLKLSSWFSGVFYFLVSLCFFSEAEALEKSKYHLFNPTPESEMRPLITDRPDKTESPITVDAGHIQVETDVVAYTLDRTASKTTQRWGVNIMNAKVGLKNNVDLQGIFETYVYEKRTKHGVSDYRGGFGDTTIRIKYNILGREGDEDFALGIMPAMKFATNTDHTGNMAAEPMLLIPAAVRLPGDWDLGFMLQPELRKNGCNRDYHFQLVSTVVIGHKIIGELAAYAEFFNAYNFEFKSDWEWTFDTGLTYLITKNIQLDTGINIGLTESADNLNPFLGLTLRH